MKHLYRYLISTQYLSIVYSQEQELHGFSDSSYASDPDDCKPFCGYVFFHTSLEKLADAGRTVSPDDQKVAYLNVFNGRLIHSKRQTYCRSVRSIVNDRKNSKNFSQFRKFAEDLELHKTWSQFRVLITVSSENIFKMPCYLNSLTVPQIYFSHAIAPTHYILYYSSMKNAS